MFLDYIKIYVKSGNGGAGAVHFRREKFIPKGGPDGGNGGKGGSIIFIGDVNTNTLLHLRYKKHIKACNGQPGMGNNKFGSDADNIYIKVPVGTVIKNDDTNIVESEILKNKQTFTIAEGGKGGLGNTNFKSSTNQSPRYAQKGLPGIEKTVLLELKILADVGLVGLPNSGKSTLLSVVSAAKPKIADYAFTTLSPNIGVVKYRNDKSFVMADIPGLIKGAADGKGLGNRFLRHLERNSTLLFLIEANSPSIKNTYNMLMHEIKKHSTSLANKKKILAISKSDLISNDLKNKIINTDIPPNIEYTFFSSLTSDGLWKLKDKIWNLIQK